MRIEDLAMKMKRGEIIQYTNTSEGCPAFCYSAKIAPDLWIVNCCNMRMMESFVLGYVTSNSNELICTDRYAYGICKAIEDITGTQFSPPLWRREADELKDLGIRDLEDARKAVHEITSCIMADKILGNNEFRSGKAHFHELGSSEVPIVHVAAGLSNYVANMCREKVMENHDIHSDKYKNNLNYAIMSYLAGDLSYLEDFADAIINDKNCSSLHNLKTGFTTLENRYQGIAERAENYVVDSLFREIQGKKTIHITDKNGDKFTVLNPRCIREDSGAALYHDDVQEHRQGYRWEWVTPVSDIVSVSYKGKEIFKRDDFSSLYESTEYQNGIDGLIDYLKENLDSWENVDKFNAAKKGDLVLDGDHFGIVCGQNEYFRDDGVVLKSVSNVQVCVSEDEMNDGLQSMKALLTDKYNQKFKSKSSGRGK